MSVTEPTASSTTSDAPSSASPSSAPRSSGGRLGLAICAVGAVAASGLLGMAATARRGYAPPTIHFASSNSSAASNAGGGETDADLSAEKVSRTDWTLPLGRFASVLAKRPDLFESDSAAAAVAANEASDVGGRWQIFFAEGLTDVQYTQQLDALHVELGVLGPTGDIEYLSDLSAAKPQKRTGPAVEEKRLYLSWSGGAHDELERSLLAAAEVDARDKLILHFIPADVEAAMLNLERSHENRKPEEISATRFGVRPGNNGHELYVIEQLTR